MELENKSEVKKGLARELGRLEAPISQRYSVNMEGSLEEVQALRNVYEILGNELGISVLTARARVITERLAKGG